MAMRFVEPDYCLFSWGANSHGQLGLGNIREQELTSPREVDLSLTDLQPENIKKIVGGAGHTLILAASGNVYSCGWNSKGQTGLGKSSTDFQKLDSLGDRKIVDLTCGWDSSMALTESGEVFVWGSNANGQLGSFFDSKVERPERLELDKPVQRIAMGLRHSVLLTRDSKIFACGAAEKGQLGIGDVGNRRSCKLIEVPDLPPIRNISCGQHHTMVITKTNDIYVWGDNKYGQLGIDPSILKIAFKPIKNQRIDASDKIHCGWTHSAVLTLDKRVLFWGRNSYGQLGRPKYASKFEFWKPEAPLLTSRIDELSIGSEHNIALTDDGIVLCWGWNEHGNCGNESTDDIFVPTKVSLPERSTASLIGTGAGHSFAVIKMKY